MASHESREQKQLLTFLAFSGLLGQTKCQKLDNVRCSGDLKIDVVNAL